MKKWKDKLRRALNDSGYTCDFCGIELFSYPQERLCSVCEERLQRNDGKICDKCGRKTVADGICLTCKGTLPTFSRGFSPFVYRAETAAFVNRMKNTKPRLACYLGEEMANYLLEKRADLLEAETPVLVIPVPLTAKREIERGYNQAYLLAENVCNRLRVLGVDTELGERVFIKTRETGMQKKMTKKERAQNVKGAYHLHKRKLCQDRIVVLVDDILTTGATASECAEKLRGAGAKEVTLLVAAALPERK